MNQAGSNCVQRWFGELTGYETCPECKGLIVDVGSDANFPHDHNSLSSPGSTFNYSLPSPTSQSGVLLPDSPPAVAAAHQQSTHDHTTPTTTTTRATTSPTAAACPGGGAICQTPAKSFFRISCIKGHPDQQQQLLVKDLSAGYQFQGMSRLQDFYPGNIRRGPGLCNACRRVEGPHPTHCPGCTANYLRQLKENPPRPPGYIGKRPPFGLAGWRVARGHRPPKPVTLHGYGCFMQRKKSAYAGKNMNNFTHLGQPPTLLVNFRGCPEN